MSSWLTTWHENAKRLVGAPLVGALGGHKGRPYGIFMAAKNLRSSGVIPIPQSRERNLALTPLRRRAGRDSSLRSE